MNCRGDRPVALTARNPKQIQMSKKLNVPNNLGADSGFWNFSALGLFVCWFVSDFGAPVKTGKVL
jgi:hypothetical protein